MSETLGRAVGLLRFEYLELTVEVLREAELDPRGAQERVAMRRGKQPSVISDHINRVAQALEVSFFEPDRRLSPAGVLTLQHGSNILENLCLLRSKLSS
jgi:hypothetical protein